MPEFKWHIKNIQVNNILSLQLLLQFNDTVKVVHGPIFFREHHYILHNIYSTVYKMCKVLKIIIIDQFKCIYRMLESI